MRRWIAISSLGICLNMAFQPGVARAMDPDYRAVLISAGAGIGIGAAAGLVTFPVSGDARSILFGSALGLVLGTVVGVYHVQHRYDPENPMQDPPPPYEEGRVLRGEMEMQWVALRF